jgi:hypothetical protein
MRRIYIPSSSLNICIPGWCCTTSGRLAQESLSRPFRRHTSSSHMSLRSHLVFIDLCIVSSLEDTPYPHPPHLNSISLRIYLRVDAHPLDASPRHSEATMTMRAAHRPNRAFESGPEAISLPRQIGDMMKASSCRNAAQMWSTSRWGRPDL